MNRSSIGFSLASAAGSDGGQGELTIPAVADWAAAFETAAPTNRAAITIGERQCMVLIVFRITAIPRYLDEDASGVARRSCVQAVEAAVSSVVGPCAAEVDGRPVMQLSGKDRGTTLVATVADWQVA
jgi:hypothetical protein